jgi:hypothetical protein
MIVHLDLSLWIFQYVLLYTHIYAHGFKQPSMVLNDPHVHGTCFFLRPFQASIEGTWDVGWPGVEQRLLNAGEALVRVLRAKS